MRFPLATAGALVALIASPISAEVTEIDEQGFVTKDVAVVEASPKQVWLSLITPSTWWNKSHTWSGDSGNLTLKPQAGGCFCEKIPEVDEPGRFTLEGSVEHMRVVQAYPETALRMVGALGPLQSEPVTGVLTIALSEVDEGTLIVFEYHVGGRMRYKPEEISKAVDGVMTQQLDGLAQLLGRVEMPEPEAPEEEVEEASEVSEEPADGEGDTPAGADLEPESQPDEADTAEAASETEPEPVEDEAPKPSVEEAFGDLVDDDGGQD